MSCGIVQPHIYARCRAHPVAGYAKVEQRTNDSLFNAVDVFFDEIARTFKVYHRISHHLPRAVVSHLPASVSLHHRDSSPVKNVLRFTRKSLCKNG